MYSENSKIVIYVYTFSKQIYNIYITVFETTALLNLPINSIFLLLFLRLLLLDLIGLWIEPRYGPSSAFLMNSFFVIKGSKLFNILIHDCVYHLHSQGTISYSKERIQATMLTVHKI